MSRPAARAASGQPSRKGVFGRLADFLDDRTGYRAVVHEALYERVPGGARWRYVWGSTLVFAFMTQVITGLFLWASYSASAQTAWESVYYIQHEMTGAGCSAAFTTSWRRRWWCCSRSTSCRS